MKKVGKARLATAPIVIQFSSFVKAALWLQGLSTL